MEFNLKMAQTLLEMFGGEDADITIEESKDDGRIYAYHTDYPEEGAIFLDE